MLVQNGFNVDMADWLSIYKEVNNNKPFTDEEKKLSWDRAVAEVPKTRKFLQQTLEKYDNFFPVKEISLASLKYARIMYAKKLLILNRIENESSN